MALFSNTRRINFPMLLKVLGWLLIIESIFMTVPLLTCVIYEENDFWSFLVAIAVTLTSGVIMTSCIRPESSVMAKREGFLLTTLVWVVFSLFGLIPFMLCEKPLDFSDAFFETMSGFSTTGASIYTDIDSLSHGINLWRCLTQWIGGMGIILFTLAVLPMLNHSGGMQMFNAEVTGITHEKLRPRISQTAKSLWMIYFILTAIVGILLWIGPMDFYDSICHAFSTMSTGGFSTRTYSIAAWDSDYVKIVVTIFMFLGGVNFALIYKTFHGDWKSLLKNDTFMAYIKIIVVAYFIVLAVILYHTDADFSFSKLVINPLFQIVTTITSTGLTVDDLEKWGSFVISILFILMFFGACAGSTSGGAKIDRLLFLLKNTNNELYRSLHPNAIRSVRINGAIISPDVVEKVIAFLCIYVMIITVGGIALSACGMTLVDAFFNSFSCVSNIGLVSDTGNTGGLSVIPDICKWILSMLMLIGRLELFTVLILFTRAFWNK